MAATPKLTPIEKLEARIARKAEAVRLAYGKVGLAKDRRPKSYGRIQSPVEGRARDRASKLESNLWDMKRELAALIATQGP
jgi:hypothetical protein